MKTTFESRGAGSWFVKVNLTRQKGGFTTKFCQEISDKQKRKRTSIKISRDAACGK